MTKRMLKKSVVALLLLSMLSAYGGEKTSAGGPKGDHWIAFSDPQLGITFKHPPQWHAWRQGQSIYVNAMPKKSRDQVPADEHSQTSPTYRLAPQVDRALNGRRLSNRDNYVLHLTVGQGTFAQANAEHRVFELGENKKPQVAFGRFRNESAHQRVWGDWRGLDSTIICSTEDEATGFHAAGGRCYWALISNERQYVLIESQAVQDSRTEDLIRRLASSIKSVKPSM
jgi:hypothetical protein